MSMTKEELEKALQEQKDTNNRLQGKISVAARSLGIGAYDDLLGAIENLKKDAKKRQAERLREQLKKLES